MDNLTDFDFYLKFTKPLILNLPQINDRVLAAAWVKKLTGDSSTEDKIKLDYLKLLLFVLQRKRLAPPFTQHPQSIEKLEEFPENQTLVDVAKAILEKEGEERRARIKNLFKGERGDYPPYISDFSANLLEYVAVQNINNFGVHAYYAVSKLPLNAWYRVDKQLLPKAAKSMLEVCTPTPTLAEVHSTPELAEPSPEKPSGAPPVEQPPAEEPPAEEQPPEKPPPEEVPPSPPKKSPRKSTLGATPPSRPIGKLAPPADDREPPSWGSNLLEAKFLEEDVGDIAAAATESEMFAQYATPMEVLWTSPPHGDPGYVLDDEAPFLVDDETDLDTSRRSFLDAQEMGAAAADYPSAASIPPSSTQAPPPPPPLAKRVKKGPPPPRPTRASLLLKKKKEASQAPPPPPPKKTVAKKSSSRISQKPSTSKVEEKPSAEAVQSKTKLEARKLPIKSKIAKKGSKGAIKGRDAAKQVIKAPGPQFSSPGEPFLGFPADDVEKYVADYKKLLREMDFEFRNEMGRVMKDQAREESKRAFDQIVTGKSRPKRQLSRLAKLSRQAIPKEHDADVDIDKSIHISPEARDIYEGIIEGPSTSRLITHAGESTMRHPRPKLRHPQRRVQDEEGVQEAESETAVASVGLDTLHGPATTESPPGHHGKDPRVVTAFNQMLNTSSKIEAAEFGDVEDSDFDDFEAMERLVEEQMKSAGQDPYATPKQKLSKKKFDSDLKKYLQVHRKTDAQMEMLEAADDEPFREGKYKTPPTAPRRKKRPAGVPSPVAEEQEEEWTSAADFFAGQEQTYDAGVDPRTKMESAFPAMEIPEDFGDLDLDEELMPDELLFSPDTATAKATDLLLMYGEYAKEQPAFKGVPVTSPRPSQSPRRQSISPTVLKRRLLANLPPLQDPHGLLPVQTTGYTPGEFSVPVTKTRKAVLPPSPPRTEEELRPPPSSPTSALAHVPPETFQMQYESPPKPGSPKLKAAPTVDLRSLSPPNKYLYTYLDNLHHQLHGPPAPQTEPTVFDVPVDTVFAESPPRQWASPVSPQLSPPIDTQKLKEDIRIGHLTPDQSPYRRAVGGRIIQRYSHGTPKQLAIPEEEEPEPYLTIEDLDFREELEAFEPITERRAIQMPYKHMRVMQRRSGPPELQPLGEVYERAYEESPERSVPDVFDLPDLEGKVWGESPPHEFFAPAQRSPYLSPEIDNAALRAAIQLETQRPYFSGADRQMITKARRPGEEHRMADKKLISKSQRPGLEAHHEFLEEGDDEAWDMRRRMMQAPTVWPARQFPKSKKTTLPAIGSPVDYPESPSARTPAPPSPSGREGPKRRALRKKLKKRKLDFSQPETSPDETHVESTEVTTEVLEERDLGAEPPQVDDWLSPRAMQDLRDIQDEAAQMGSPRTPPRINIGAEAFPEMDNLPEFSPSSPLSQYGVIQGVMEQVKSHVPTQPRNRKQRALKDLYKLNPWKKLPDFEENPLEEAQARIHEQMEREVDAEMAAQEAEWQRQQAGPIDAPIPGGLGSPIRPPCQVPFYETPPHLKRSPPKFPTQQPRSPIVYRNVLEMERPPDMYVSPEVSPEHGGLEEEAFPEDFGSPTAGSPCPPCSGGRMGGANVTVLDTSPCHAGREASPGGGNVNLLQVEAADAAEREAQRVQQIADAQYASLFDTPPRGQTPPIQHMAERQYAARTPPSREGRPPPPFPEPRPSTSRRAAEQAQQIADAQYAARFETPQRRPPRTYEEMVAVYNAARTPSPPKWSPEMTFQSQVSPSQIAKKLEASEAYLASLASSSRLLGPEVVEFEYQEQVTEKKPPKAVKSTDKMIKAIKGKGPADKGKGKAPCPAKGKAPCPAKGKAVAASRSDKSIKSSKSDKSIKSAKSDKSIKSQKSDASIPRPKKKKFEAKSKIDTGRGKKKKKEEPKEAPKEEPAVEIDYDLSALLELGVAAADLQSMNLDDNADPLNLVGEAMPQLAPAGSPERPFDPRWPQRRQRPSRGAAVLPALQETEEEHEARAMGWNMRWDLSPESRVNMRIPGIKQLPSPPRQDSRFQFQKVALQSPPRVAAVTQLPPARGRELLVQNLDAEAMPGMMDDVMGAQEVVAERADQAWQQLAEADMEIMVDEEDEPDFHSGLPTLSPSPIRRRLQIDRPPVSPELLSAELQSHEVYYPAREQLKKTLKIDGKFTRQRGMQQQQQPLSPVYEDWDARRAAVARQAQIAEAARPRIQRPPSPPSPTDEEIRKSIEEHKQRRYRKTFKRPGKRVTSELSPPVEEEEDFNAQFATPPRGFPAGLPPEMLTAEELGGLDVEQAPGYYSPVSPLMRVEEYVDVFERDEEAAELSPFQLPPSPEALPVKPHIRAMIPSPPRAERYRAPELEPFYMEAHGLPEAESMRPKPPPTPPSPRMPSVPKAERKIVRRRLDFDQPASPCTSPCASPQRPPSPQQRQPSPQRPPSPQQRTPSPQQRTPSPQGGPCQQRQPSPQRSPYQQSPPMQTPPRGSPSPGLFAEEEPWAAGSMSYLDAVCPDELSPEEQNAIDVADAEGSPGSPGMGMGWGPPSPPDDGPPLHEPFDWCQSTEIKEDWWK